MSKLREYETIVGNKILCCDRCSVYIKNKKKEIEDGRRL
jgi:hypothetical protein